MERLVDAGSLFALTERDTSGMFAAYGNINGSRVSIFATDATIQGGAMGEAGAHVILKAYEDAMAHKNPVIGIWHSGGARLREGVASLHAFGLVFHAITQASGKIPQLSLVVGPAAGGGRGRRGECMCMLVFARSNTHHGFVSGCLFCFFFFPAGCA
jgi:acetyl-CoA/propionyl-CoA carboxylase carboxyl transferase subunit